MSLTSYRTAPPRDDQGSKVRDQRTDHGGRVWASGGKRVVTRGRRRRSEHGRLARRAAKQQPARRGGVQSPPGEGPVPGHRSADIRPPGLGLLSSVFWLLSSVFCLLASGLCPLTPGSTCDLCPLTSGSTWRRPALPPLRGAVPWARRSFTAEFGMGSGGTSAL
jgi:hypothetical protein